MTTVLLHFLVLLLRFSISSAAFTYNNANWLPEPTQCGGLTLYNDAKDATSCKSECAKLVECDVYQFDSTGQCWLGVPTGACNLKAKILDGGRKASGCGSYCATQGCGWTAKYQCPWANMVLSKATSDGSRGYECCCNARTSDLESCHPKYDGFNGVNVGGWVLYEAWIFSTSYPDDFHWEQQGETVVTKHRETWFTEQDFADMADAGLDAVRIPVGYWILDIPGLKRYPYDASTGQKLEPTMKDWVGPAENFLEDALTWAQKYGLKVNLDLHSAPGGQSGAQTTGYKNSNWKPSFWDIDTSVTVMGYLAQRFGNRIELLTVLNEPSTNINLGTLTNYYERAYKAIRVWSQVAVVFPVYQYDVSAMSSFISTANSYTNYYFDVHQYWCFSNQDLQANIKGADGGGSYPNLFKFPDMQRVIVSEYSLCTHGSDIGDYGDNWKDKDKIFGYMREFGFTQLEEYRQIAGWFYWSWKGQDPITWGSPWSLKQNIAQKVMAPSQWTTYLSQDPVQDMWVTSWGKTPQDSCKSWWTDTSWGASKNCDKCTGLNSFGVSNCAATCAIHCDISLPVQDTFETSWGKTPRLSCQSWWTDTSWGADKNCDNCTLGSWGTNYCAETCASECQTTSAEMDALAEEWLQEGEWTQDDFAVFAFAGVGLVAILYGGAKVISSRKVTHTAIPIEVDDEL